MMWILAASAQPLSNWWSENWFSLAQTVGIIVSLGVAAAALRADFRTRREEMRARRAETLMLMTQYHREIWGRVIDDESLDRIFETEADLAEQPMTAKERMLCTFLILHLFASFEARRAGVFEASWSEARDIGQLFTRPIPAAAWEAVKPYQDPHFVEFVDAARAEFGHPARGDGNSQLGGQTNGPSEVSRAPV